MDFQKSSAQLPLARKGKGFFAYKAVIRLVLVLGFVLAAILPGLSVSAAPPVVVTNNATDVTENTATLDAEVSDFGTAPGPDVYLFFEYCTDGYFNAFPGMYNKKTTEITWTITDGVTLYAADIIGLTNGTEYHFRAALRYGTAYVYGGDVTFTTNMAPPDTTPEILSLKAYKDLLEPNDVLFVILADIKYDIIPDIPVSRSFIWSLMENGVEVGWNVGYAMHDNGYGLNVYSLYFPAIFAIDWGNITDYSLQLAGSPDVFALPVPVYDIADSVDYYIIEDTWVSAPDYHIALASALAAVARTLEQEWQVVLLDEQDTKTVLSSNGEKLFRNAIPGIQTMAPSLFYIQSEAADVGARVWGTALDTTYKARLAGADGIIGTADDNWIAGSIEGVADWLNVPWLLFIGLIAVALCVFVIWKSSTRFGTPVPGYIAALIVVLCVSMLALGLTVMAIIALVLVIAGGWLLFMRRA
jgi:hypothetical protein